MLQLSAQEIENLFTPTEVIEIVRQGIINDANGVYSIPQRSHYERGKSINLIMPAYGPKYYCTKLISVDPHNPKAGLPSISGLLVLNNNKNGVGLALMDAPKVTALRTAAIGGIGVGLISDDNVRKLGIIGLGVQGYWQTIYALSVRAFDEIYCYSRSSEKYEGYRKKIAEKYPDLKITWCKNAEQVVENSEVIVSCTTSKQPVFNAEDLDLSKKRFLSIGSFTKEMQEFPSEVYKVSDVLLLDTSTAFLEVGDVINSIKNNWVKRSNIFTLGELLTRKKHISTSDKIAFKSVGMAAFDLALASAIYERIRNENNQE